MSVPNGRNSNPPEGDSGGANPLKNFSRVAMVAVAGLVGIGALGFALLQNDDSAAGSTETDTEAASQSSAPAGQAVVPDSNAPGAIRIESCDDIVAAVGGLEFVIDDDVDFERGRVGEGEEASIEEFARCLEFGQVAVLVSGTEAQGIYSNYSGARAVVVSGMGLAEEDGVPFPYFGQGQCFVGGEGEPFQTKIVASADDWETMYTVDVGVSFGGGDAALQLPFMGIVIEDTNADPSVTHFYEPSLPGANADVTVVSERFTDRDNPWAGYAILFTTTHNNRKFFPYLDGVYDTKYSKQWEGPAENVVVTVVCG